MNDAPVTATVLMPVYNGEKYIREAMDSILNQTFNDFEFLIVNDGSTDSTKQLIESYPDPRIRLVNQENRGVAKSLNRGLRLAKGKYIARMDADDISLPDRLAKQIEVLESNPDVDITVSCIEGIDSQGNLRTQQWQADREAIRHNEIIHRLPVENCIAHPAIIIRANVLKKRRV